MKLSELTDRQILIHLVHRVRGLKQADARIEKRLDNHLKHVWALVMAVVAIAGAAVVALLFK